MYQQRMNQPSFVHWRTGCRMPPTAFGPDTLSRPLKMKMICCPVLFFGASGTVHSATNVVMCCETGGCGQLKGFRPKGISFPATYGAIDIYGYRIAWITYCSSCRAPFNIQSVVTPFYVTNLYIYRYGMVPKSDTTTLSRYSRRLATGDGSNGFTKLVGAASANRYAPRRRSQANR